MIGTLDKVISDMNSGVYNYTDKDGNCTGCGNCCSALLPLSRKEIRDIERYVRKKKIKPCDHTTGIPTTDTPIYDLTCPFRDNVARKCILYNTGFKPYICESFKCDKPQKQIEIDRKLISEKRYTVNMWNFFTEIVNET